ncbi:conserved hypothetical protein [Gammaproteobacteria bacterium]
MNAAVIIERIQGAVERGSLRPIVERTAFAPLETMGDLLRPWEECFPGVASVEEGEDAEDFKTNRRTMSRIRKPRFTPQPRRSRRALPAPRLISAAPKLVHPGLFRSISAVWEFYKAEGRDKPELVEQPLSFDGMHAFLDPLWRVLSDYYPLFCDIENVGSDGPVNEMDCLTMMLPNFDWNDEGIGVVEAFLSGPSAIAGMMGHFDGTFIWDLPKPDQNLLAKLPWDELTITYRDASGKKSYDIWALENFEENFFAKVKERFPGQYANGFDIIAEGYENTVVITCAQDIEFAIAYAEAFECLSAALPDWNSFEHSSEASGKFAHELCNVWRRANGKKQVKWTGVDAEGRARS